MALRTHRHSSARLQDSRRAALHVGPCRTGLRHEPTPSTSTQLSRARLTVLAKASKAASKQSAAPVTTVVTSSGPQVAEAVTYSVTASTVYTAVLFLAMILLPRLDAVRKAMQSYWVFAPLAVVYFVLMAMAWTPDTLSTLMPGSLAAGFSGGFNPQFFPALSGISTLFSQPATAASLLLHILAINLFLGRSIYLDGLATGVPTAHSLAVASVFGPLGFLLHWLTKSAWSSVQPREQVLNSGDGRIIILPYGDY